MSFVTCEEVADLFRAGHKPRSIALEKNLTISQVYEKLYEYEEKHGKIDRISKVAKKSITPEAVAKLYNDGMTINGIAKKLGISSETVKKHIREFIRIYGEDQVRKPEEIENKSQSEKREKQKIPNQEEKKTESQVPKKVEVQKPVEFVLPKVSIPERRPIKKEEDEPITLNSEEEIQEFINAELKGILMSGITFKKWRENGKYSKYIPRMEEQIAKLRVVAECAFKSDEGSSPDEKFLQVVKIVQNSPNNYIADSTSVKRYISPKDTCRQGKLDKIRYSVLDNNDLAVAALSGMQIRFEGYDLNMWNSIIKKYERKVDTYISRIDLLKNKHLPQNLEKKPNSTPEFEDY